MPSPVNIVQGHYFLGTVPLPDDKTAREAALFWYQLGHTEGLVDAAVFVEKRDHELGMDVMRLVVEP
jgi:hypothetical protein